ncbi:MAG: putative transcriptional regulator, partial [Conexibacter sp.]|nr:putative transcriptional regulator [Conexibacter sp.]
MSRTAAATREDVVRAAARRFRGGERIDVQAVVGDTGVARATVHRWFGTREGLIGEAIVVASEPVFAAARRTAEGRGAAGLVDAFDGVVRRLAADEGLRRFLETEREAALRILTSSGGVVQPAWVARTGDLLAGEVAAGRFRPAADVPTLAYAVVRLTEAFLYNDAAAGLRGDVARLRTVLAALLGA